MAATLQSLRSMPSGCLIHHSSFITLHNFSVFDFGIDLCLEEQWVCHDSGVLELISMRRGRKFCGYVRILWGCGLLWIMDAD
ncbi:hypothetical protein VNO77_42529 [Canavalia gladiata]|uniref:Uncharacterized protein n=1 Tax=Canavalia gladiata TaxID=3824 RepID=A0AAN9JW16_CANGL